ncbi:hypothetical protein PIB30_036913 [Stylosanthes scabra]|uniref:Uncharacterized protein n=1 Tax=Stylosanthes scabra TaxID=79078 RepID=A0ABU6QE37_9FABA|nr:hypothetical protein [Stylosanthes scabra]
MLLYFITCVSFLVFLKSLIPIKPLPPSWTSEVRLISFLFCEDLSVKIIPKLFKRFWILHLCQVVNRMSLMKKTLTSSKVENVEDTNGMEWKWHVASKRNVCSPRSGKQRSLMRLVSLHWPFSWMRSRLDENNNNNNIIFNSKSTLPSDSMMTWYLALETGNFWFPAQVYNRENGHVGFMLSCYDAELSYDPHTDTFQARYPPHGRRAVAIEHGIQWERLRSPPVDTPPHDLHITDCLNDLHPGDHIEIQWRRNKEFPYGWWYGIVGHLETCDGNENYCRCHNSDTVMLEFNQYTPDSRWRRTTISRKDHREEGNEADGFYGGIRKIKTEREISTWKSLWPSEVLD